MSCTKLSSSAKKVSGRKFVRARSLLPHQKNTFENKTQCWGPRGLSTQQTAFRPSKHRCQTSESRGEKTPPFQQYQKESAKPTRPYFQYLHSVRNLATVRTHSVCVTLSLHKCVLELRETILQCALNYTFKNFFFGFGSRQVIQKQASS